MDKVPEDFSELRKLLSIKRYEMPPPAYFKNFPNQVIARLEAQAAFDSVPFWRRWLSELFLRPAAATAYGVLLGGLGLLALGLAKSPVIDAPLPSATIWASPSPIQPFASREAPVQWVSHDAILPSSTSPVLSSVDSPFAHVLRVERTSFSGR